MSATVLLLASLVLGSPPGEATEKKYEIDFSKTTSSVKPEGDGMFWMHIKAAPGFKVSTEAPLKIALASEALKLQRQKLSAKDAKDKKATSPEFGVKFGAAAACQASIEVDATFFVCDEKICERKKEKVSVPVSVRD